MAQSGPVTAQELAELSSLQRRYLQEWLSAMAAAGWIEYNAEAQRCTLPSEHAAFIALEDHPMYIGGALEALGVYGATIPKIIDCFRRGGGVSLAEQRVVKPRQLEEGKLKLRFERDASRFAYTGEVVAYTHCNECDPIVYESTSSFAGRVCDRRVWVEYELDFRDGRLAKAVALSAKTREETREQMLRAGVAALPDEDRVARRHLEMLRKEANSQPRDL